MIAQAELSAEWEYIENERELSRAAAALERGSGPIGIDTERASGFRYRQNAYLIQVHREDSGTFLFDPVALTDFRPLEDAIAHEEWIFHAASQDLPCLAELGLQPPRIFDTELAGRLLGFERVGLGAVVQQLLGISLDKAHSADDWSQRPLPRSWLDYAAFDVSLLPELRQKMSVLLAAENKTEIANEEFEAVRTRPPRERTGEPWRRLSGTHKLRSPRQLAMARELWIARDELARQRDVAPGRLVPDASLIAAVLANPRSAGELASLRTFRGRESRKELDRWWNALRKGKITDDLPGAAPRDPHAIPHHRTWPERHPEAAARLTAAREALQQEADQRRIPLENLLTPDTLRRVAWDPPTPITVDSLSLRMSELGARPWQCQLTAPIIAREFVGSA